HDLPVPARHRLAEPERRRRGDRLHRVGAVGAHGGGGRAVEVDVGELPHARGQALAQVHDLPVDALARGIKDAVQVHHVTELELADGLGDVVYLDGILYTAREGV